VLTTSEPPSSCCPAWQVANSPLRTRETKCLGLSCSTRTPVRKRKSQRQGRLHLARRMIAIGNQLLIRSGEGIRGGGVTSADYEIVSFLVKAYHSSLNDTLRKVVGTAPEAKALLELYAWIKE
jgi:hypothetical protein